MADSLRTLIYMEVVTRLKAVTEFENDVYFDKVKLVASDLQDTDLPYCQIIDLGETPFHEMRRVKKQWNLLIEIIIGPETSGDPPNQEDLWDLMEKAERTLWGVPNLGIPGVIHMIMVGTSTDLHMMEPYYVGRIELYVEYYQPLVDVC